MNRAVAAASLLAVLGGCPREAPAPADAGLRPSPPPDASAPTAAKPPPPCVGGDERHYEKLALSRTYVVGEEKVTVSGEAAPLSPGDSFRLPSGKEQSVRVTLDKIAAQKAYFTLNYSAWWPACKSEDGCSSACTFVAPDMTNPVAEARRVLSLRVLGPGGEPARGCVPLQLAGEGKGPYRWAWPDDEAAPERVYALTDSDQGRKHVNVRCEQGYARELIDLGPKSTASEVRLKAGTDLRVELPKGLPNETVTINLGREDGLWDFMDQVRAPTTSYTFRSVPPGWYRVSAFVGCQSCGNGLCADRSRVVPGPVLVVRLRSCPKGKSP